jgi:hypothetical protein
LFGAKSFPLILIFSGIGFGFSSLEQEKTNNRSNKGIINDFIMISLC